MNECNVFTFPEVWKSTTISEYLAVHWFSTSVILHYYPGCSNSAAGEARCSWQCKGQVFPVCDFRMTLSSWAVMAQKQSLRKIKYLQICANYKPVCVPDWNTWILAKIVFLCNCDMKDMRESYFVSQLWLLAWTSNANTLWSRPFP